MPNSNPFSTLPGVGAIGDLFPFGITPTQEAIDGVAHTDALITQLAGGIDQAGRTARPETEPGQMALLLRVQYFEFQTRWIAFKRAFDLREVGAVTTALDQTRSFTVEYDVFKTRLETLPADPAGPNPIPQPGPSQPLPFPTPSFTPNPPPDDSEPAPVTPSLAMQVLPFALGGAFLYLLFTRK